MDSIPEYVKAIIYTITCTHPASGRKMYVGQTRTHILNHGKYRPFGANKRWAQHVSEARKNAPIRQSWKLNNAIRLYGPESFEVEELGDCDLDMADTFERAFIRLHRSDAEGYNIQKGGRSGAKNSTESRMRIARTLMTQSDRSRLAAYADKDVVRARFVRLEDKGVRVYVVEDGGRTTYTSFFGRHSTLTESAERALAFARALVAGDDTKLHTPVSLIDVIKLDI